MKKITVRKLIQIGFKKKDLANACRVSEPCIQKWERNGIPEKRMKKITKMLLTRQRKVNNFVSSHIR